MNILPHHHHNGNPLHPTQPPTMATATTSGHPLMPEDTAALDTTAAYCRLACDLIGRNLVDLQQQKAETVMFEGVEHELPNRSKYREWFMAMTAQLMDEQHPGYVPSSPSTSSSSATTAAALHEINSNNIPACNDCGSALQPGFHGSTMRLIRVASPPRKRQPKANKSSSSKAGDDPLVTWKVFGTSTTGTAKQQQQQHASSTKGCRNKMVLICGTCKGRTIYPGIPLRSTQTDFNSEKERKPGSRPEKRKFQGKVTKEEQATKKRTTETTLLDDNLDFVPLGGGSPKKGRGGDSAKKRLADLTALHNPKTLKKAKKKKKPSSQLLDFLSNLNN